MFVCSCIIFRLTVQIYLATLHETSFHRLMYLDADLESSASVMQPPFFPSFRTNILQISDEIEARGICRHFFKDRCPGFGWDRVNSLLSSWCSAVFWI